MFEAEGSEAAARNGRSSGTKKVFNDFEYDTAKGVL
jgi:hypothetical protein